MAEPTTLDEKLAEVIGLAMAARGAATKVKGMLDDGDLARRLNEMSREAAEAEERASEHLKNAQAGLVLLAAQEDPDASG